MYLIRLASGQEATFTSVDELTQAIQRGEVGRDALIFHRRTGQWLPIEQHPHFFAAEDAPTPPPDAPAPRPIAPTPFPVREADHSQQKSRVPPFPPTPPAAEPPAAHAGRRHRISPAMMIVLGGGVIGLAIGWQLRPGSDGSPPWAESVSAAEAYRPAPAPSSLLRSTDDSAAPPARAQPTPSGRPGTDPLAPITADVLAERYDGAFSESRRQLETELAGVGFDRVFGVQSLATPAGAQAGRRTVASAMNIVGQYHRRGVMLDQAYRDTAVFQTTRAGWSTAERQAWDRRPSQREAYAAADLAESLLADADSLLAILVSSGSYMLRGDTISFDNPETTAAYQVQRARLVDRAGEPVGDGERRATLALVRRSIDPAVLPVAAP